MNATAELKIRIMEYIDSADERLLRMIQALAESYREGEIEEELPFTHKKELDKRIERYNSGQTHFYSWEEVLEKLNTTE